MAAALVPPGDVTMFRSSARCRPLRRANAADPSTVRSTSSAATREAEVHAGVDERLHQQEHVRRSGAGERGRHVDHALLLDLDLLAERAEDRLRAVALIALDARGRAP